AVFVFTVALGLLATSSPGLGSRVGLVEYLPDRGLEHVRLAGLGDEGVAAGGAGALGLALEGVAGERDDGDVARAAILLERARGLPAVEPGQREVHDD